MRRVNLVKKKKKKIYLNKTLILKGQQLSYYGDCLGLADGFQVPAGE
jgi:hypothetical protein